MAAGVERRDLGIGRLREQLASLRGAKLQLGVMGDAAAETHPVAKVSVGTLAKWLHFGTEKMDPRPFVDHAINEIKDRTPRLMAKAVSDLIDGRARSAEAALRPVAKEGAIAVRDAIDDANSWVEWELSQRTINRKGHDRHLVDTGTVRDAVGYGVVLGGRRVSEGTAK